MEIVRVEKINEKTTEIELETGGEKLRIDVKADNSVHIYTPKRLSIRQIKNVHDLTIEID